MYVNQSQCLIFSRQAQVDLILKTKIDQTPEGKKALGEMLREILGFFIVEHRVAHTTRDFRSKARVSCIDSTIIQAPCLTGTNDCFPY